MNNKTLLGLIMLLGVSAWVVTAWVFIPSNMSIKIEDITPLHKAQPIMKCYSAFDIYLTDAYEIVDNNKTLITSHGRVYNASDCGLVKE